MRSTRFVPVLAALSALGLVACGAASQQTTTEQAAAHKDCCAGKSEAEKADCCGAKDKPAVAEAKTEDCCAGGEHAADAPALKQIDPAGLQTKLQAAHQIFVFDANSQARYDQGHVPGAVRMTSDAFAADKLPPNKDAMLVFYCGGVQCKSAEKVARLAAGAGYGNVWVMPEGIRGWEAAGLPTDKAAAAGGESGRPGAGAR